MPLTRKIHNSGRSIILTIPSQLVEAFDLSNGDLVEILPIKNGEIKFKKVENNQTTEMKR